ncbi:yqaJ domain-containing protein [Trichonephila clavipes]|nr:yqaJ domain-containing protein [Trichonephila clavipes]
MKRDVTSMPNIQEKVREIERTNSRKKSTPCSKLVMRIVYGRDLCNAAMKYGLANEEIARKQYEREYSTEVKICGLFVDKDKPFLCASPDGLVAGTPEFKPTMQHHVDHEFVTMNSCLLGPPISSRTGYRKNCP